MSENNQKPDIKKKSFVLYLDQYEPIKDLTNEQKGQLLDAMFNYHGGSEYEIIDPMAKMAFSFLKQTFDRDHEKWMVKAQKNKLNGKKGGRPKKNKNKDLPTEENPDNPDGLKETQNNPNNPDGSLITQPNPEKPVSVSVSVSVSDSVSDKEKIKTFSPEIKNFTEAYQKHVSSKFEKTAPIIDNKFLHRCNDTIEKLIRLDGFTLDEIIECLRWASNDDFWSNQIVSLAQLRVKSKDLTKFQKVMNKFKSSTSNNKKLNKADLRTQANLKVAEDFINE
jgi:hypothetical protein